MSPDERLMNYIRVRWGRLIESETSGSIIRPAFLAALIANESGGDPRKTRFEPRVFKVLQRDRPAWTVNRQKQNSISWGLTQILGENYWGPPPDLAEPEINLQCARLMLVRFSNHNMLDPGKDFDQLFRCWNTGGPRGKTYDPDYCKNGLARIVIWNEQSLST